MSRQRSIITPEHFVVAPEVLGMPLASPSRRAWAMAIDLLLVAILVKAGGVLLGVVAATVLFRAAKPDPASGFVKRYVRTILQLSGAVILFVVVLRGFDNVRDRFTKKAEPSDGPVVSTSDSTAGDVDLNLSTGQLANLAGPMMRLRRSEDSAQVEQAATEVLEAVRSGGASEADISETRDGLIKVMKNRDPSRIGAIDHAMRNIVGEQKAVPPDSVLRRYLTAIDTHDTLTARSLRDSLKNAVAGGDIASLNKRLDVLRERNASLEKQVEAAEKPHGIRTFLADAADDMGVGFGWSAVYFTAFWALWRGQTPGKKLAGVRIIRLDGKPLGWWMSFERFGGYAASFSVGLMGFLQILWDRNRQGLHDKACETVVVRTASLTPADRTAAPASAGPYRPR